MTIGLTPLPYPSSALQPFISEATVTLHHGAHQAGHVKNLNRLRDGDTRPLDAVLRDTTGNIFNTAAQIWNHEFLWGSLAPPHPLEAEISRAFGSSDSCISKLIASAPVPKSAVEFLLPAERGSTTNGILSNPYLDANARSDDYEIRISLTPNGWSYESTTVLSMSNLDQPLHHTDRNSLTLTKG